VRHPAAEPMKKWPALPALLCAIRLALGVGATFAQKKSENPVRERFEADITPAISSDNNMSLAIQELSSDQELQDLALTFARGGGDALHKALAKVKKGYFRMGGSPTMPLVLITSRSEGSGRKMNFVGLVPMLFAAELGGWYPNQPAGYPYMYVRLEVNEQGKGHGVLFPHADVRFDEHGRVVVQPRPLDGRVHDLLNVHLVK
jgi:hypothetical protein